MEAASCAARVLGAPAGCWLGSESAKVAFPESGVLPAPGGFGLQASVGVWIGHLYCTTDGDCQAEYVENNWSDDIRRPNVVQQAI